MNSISNISTDLFYKIRSRFTGLKLGAQDGTVTIFPEDARFFDFDYTDGEQPIGHVSISLAEDNSIKVYFSTNITEDMNTSQRKGWYSFLRELRQFAKRRLMAFDTRDITKDNLDQRDYKFLSRNKTKDTELGEKIMKESAMYGTRTVSYQKLLDTRLIIKHSQALVDSQQPGARTRNISALFVENQDGERFKYPFIHLAGARAMQRHVANGGLPYDDVGKSIISMSEEIAQLKSFSGYVVRNDLMNSDNNDIVSRSKQRLESLKEQIQKLAKQKHYEAYRESFTVSDPIEMPDDVVNDLVEKFTVKSFKEDIKSAFPAIYRLMQESSATVDYDDIVSMTSDKTKKSEKKEKKKSDFDKFESWIMNLGEESAITSDDEEEKDFAIDQLQSLLDDSIPVGIDGMNAIESMKNIINDPALFTKFRELSKEDPQADARELIQAWVKENASDVLDRLDFTSDEGNDFDTDFDNDADDSAGDDADFDDKVDDSEVESESQDEKNKPKKYNSRDLAEFISSFYDRETGTFPKGPEGVSIMVNKKYGPKAESIARHMIERMAPQQVDKSDDTDLQELSRIKELAQVSSSNNGELDEVAHARAIAAVANVASKALSGDDDSDDSDELDEIARIRDLSGIKEHAIDRGTINGKKYELRQLKGGVYQIVRLEPEDLDNIDLEDPHGETSSDGKAFFAKWKSLTNK